MSKSVKSLLCVVVLGLGIGAIALAYKEPMPSAPSAPIAAAEPAPEEECPTGGGTC